MKKYYVEAKTSTESLGNAISFYKEDGKIWIALDGCEERGFTFNEAMEIAHKIIDCIEK